MSRRMFGGIVPDTEAENDGRCIMSDLLPSACGLRCHRNSADIGLLDDILDTGHEL